MIPRHTSSLLQGRSRIEQLAGLTSQCTVGPRAYRPTGFRGGPFLRGTSTDRPTRRSTASLRQLTCNAGRPHCRMKWGCWDEIEATDKKVWGQGECSCWRGEMRLLLSQWTARLKGAQRTQLLGRACSGVGRGTQPSRMNCVLHNITRLLFVHSAPFLFVFLYTVDAVPGAQLSSHSM